MLILFIVLFVLICAAVIFLNHPRFGKAPSGERLQRIKKSLNYRNGKFQNVHFTPMLTEGYSLTGVIGQQLFKKHPGRKPKETIPSIKTDLGKLPIEEDILVWFGHSAYYFQLAGKRFLVDPVFSGQASPIPGTVKPFEGSDIYQVSDIPPIDFLFISHDHYDHLDYRTIIQLRDKVKTVVCGLGVGSHLQYWGYDEARIIEKDWDETFPLTGQITVHSTSARHFSGRRFTRNNTLWLAFLIETVDFKMYLGGDSGYDTHFLQIGDKFGPIDFAILEDGQYNAAWEAIHMLPSQVSKAAKDLRAKRIMPVHNSKFALGMHPWNEPLIRLSGSVADTHRFLVTPVIGELVSLRNEDQKFSKWWEKIK